MLQFNELRITEDSKELIIDVSIKGSIDYKDVLLDCIYLDDQDTYVNNGPSNTPLMQYKVKDAISLFNPILEGKHTVYDKETDDIIGVEDYTLLKQFRLVIPLKEFNLPSNKMYFVYVTATGTPSPSVSCNQDNSIIMGTVIDSNILYQSTICYVRELANTCQLPQNLANRVLLNKALELSIKTGNYLLAIKYWKKFYQNIKTPTIIKTSCNG